jgi:hypothetical protein
MPIILTSNEGAGLDPFNYFKYPHHTKVLSGTLYGKDNEYQGSLRPENYVHDYEQLKLLSKDKTDLKQG